MITLHRRIGVSGYMYCLKNTKTRKQTSWSCSITTQFTDLLKVNYTKNTQIAKFESIEDLKSSHPELFI